MDMVDETITVTPASSKVDQNDPHYVFAADLSDIQKAAGGCLPLQIQNHSMSLFYHNSKVYAIDNRCPHMGFPLHRGTVKDGILTCHWHHARFDLIGGGTFDQWAGDVRSFPVQIRNGNEIWVSLSSFIDPNSYNETLLQNALKQNISLMIAKAVIAMSEQGGRYKNGDRNSKDDDYDHDVGFVNAFCTGLDFGTHYKQSGWGQGLTILTGMMNISRFLDLEISHIHFTMVFLQLRRIVFLCLHAFKFRLCQILGLIYQQLNAGSDNLLNLVMLKLQRGVLLQL